MRKLLSVLFGLALGLLLTGCGRGLPQSREMDNMILMSTLGVDVGEEDAVALTASGSRGTDPVTLSAARPTLAGAFLALRGMGDGYVFFGHADRLLLGEELAARGGVEEVLFHFSQAEELGLGTQVWLIRDNSAQSALEAAKETGVGDRLTSLWQQARFSGAGVTCTAGETLTRLLENGSALLPALTVGEKPLLQTGGYAVLTGEGLAGFLTGEQARGLELALERPGAGLLELEGTAVRLRMATLTCVPRCQDGLVSGLELDLRLIAQREQSRGQPDPQMLREEVARRAQRQLTAAVKQLQVWNADCLGLKQMAGSARPEVWNLLCRQWEQRFPRLELEVRCTVTLTGGEV